MLIPRLRVARIQRLLEGRELVILAYCTTEILNAENTLGLVFETFEKSKPETHFPDLQRRCYPIIPFTVSITFWALGM